MVKTLKCFNVVNFKISENIWITELSQWKYIFGLIVHVIKTEDPDFNNISFSILRDLYLFFNNHNFHKFAKEKTDDKSK